MPLSYNTTPPTASNKNTINDIAVNFGIRDFLLNKNIGDLYPAISTSLNGSAKIGEPILDTMIGSGSVLKQTSIEIDGILRVQNATSMNEFKDTSSLANQLVSIDNVNPLHNTNPSIEEDSNERAENATSWNEFKNQSSTANEFVSVEDKFPFINSNPTIEDSSKSTVEDATSMNEFKDTGSLANEMVEITDINPLNNTNASIEEDSKLRVENATSMNNIKDTSSLANEFLSIDTTPPPTNPTIEEDSKLRVDNATVGNQYKNPQPDANVFITVDNITKDNSLFPNSSVPNGIGTYPMADVDIAKYGLLGKTTEQEYRKKATIKNLYLDYSKQVDTADWIALQPSDIPQQVAGYLDQYGALNAEGGNVVQAADIIGSLLSGQGLGFTKSGLITNFDLRSSLAGRVLSAAGGFQDTKLGQIGAQQLALALINNAAFNTEQEILGTFNAADNVLSLVKNGTLAGFRPNYKITVPTSIGGRVLDAGAKILGFTLPRSFLQDAGSIFLSESNSGNVERANSMLLNTGKGQVTALITNMNANLIGTTQFDNPSTTSFRTGYAPGYRDNRGDQAINPSLYAFYNSDGATIYNFIAKQSGSTSVIPEISYNRSEMINKYGFTGPEDNVGSINSYTKSTIKTPTFTWGSTLGNGVNNVEGADQFLAQDKKKSLLSKTQMLFNDIGMKNIVSTKGQMGLTPSQIQTAVVGGGISKGSAVLSKGSFNPDGTLNIGTGSTPDTMYCRAWTTLSRYSQVKNLVRNRGIDSGNPYRFHIQGSVLDDNGFVKIAPYITDSKTDPKKFMFSIENLAWFDDLGKLLPSEIGPGDLLSGKKGRIMWFPPYNINFTENSSASWESTNFIGRGEPVYTYNNSERGGTLSFQVIIDHPSYLNAFRGDKGPIDEYINSYFAGCVELESRWAERLTVYEQQSVANTNITIPQKQTVESQTPPSKIDIYFPNDVTSLPSNYENGLSGTTSADTIDYSLNVNGEGFGIGTYPGDITSNTSWNDKFNYGLNGINNPIDIDGTTIYGVLDPNLVPALRTYLEQKCPLCRAEVTGYASSQGKANENEILANNRASNIVTWLKTNVYSSRGFDDTDLATYVKKVSGVVEPNTGGNSTPTDDKTPKLARRATIRFIFDPTLSTQINEPNPVIGVRQNTSVNTSIKNRFYDESHYFDKLTQEDSFVFDKIRDKIKYFHPAFHSTTPEGLNSRLTFLNQCTRQGPSIGSETNNLAFGRAPVCILRIGDFYNTKIVIDNIGIDYEPLVWDLNPEGVGVQPMIANINMSFKFIGGSTLQGPINKLQNALSFNYYANAQVYDTRADYIAYDPNQNIKDQTTGQVVKFGANLVNGDSRLESETVTVTQSNIVDGTPILDQAKGNDDTNGPKQPQTSAEPIDDKNVISKIGLQGYYNVVSGGDVLKLSFRFNQTKDLPFNLDDTTAKTYKGQIYITNTSNVTQKNNIRYVTVHSNGVNNGVVFGSPDSTEVVIPNDIQNPWNIDVQLTAEQSKMVVDGLNTAQSNIVVEWETGSKNHMNFSTNLAI